MAELEAERDEERKQHEATTAAFIQYAEKTNPDEIPEIMLGHFRTIQWYESHTSALEKQVAAAREALDTLVNDGGGFYTIQIDATLFGQGVQNFDIYFAWTGSIQQYEDKMTAASVNIIGVDSQLTLLQSSEPTPYQGSMLYIFNYAETSGIGITNTSYGGGNVHISVSFQGETVALGLVTITEIDPILELIFLSLAFSAFQLPYCVSVLEGMTSPI